jgi:predicted nucleic acid-binding protein
MSDAYLLDTNVICALADATGTAHALALDRFMRVSEGFVLLPSMAIAEIEFGMAKAPDIAPEKRDQLRAFIARFDHVPFDDASIEPFACIRSELWEMFGTPKRGRQNRHKERRPEDLLDKVTGKELGIDEPDLLIASIALSQNLVLVSNDINQGMRRILDAAESAYARSRFPIRLRVENWLHPRD